MKSIAVLVLLVAVVHSGQVCKQNSECQTGECCQIMSEFMIVSKRDALLPGVSKVNTERTGTCEPYRHEGDHCSLFARANGYCSCEPGTKCKGSEVKVEFKVKPQNRRDMPMAKPGYRWVYQCVKQ